MTSEASDLQRDEIVRASVGQPFRFEQGSSLHAVLLGMAMRPAGPEDQAAYMAGISSGATSISKLDLGQIHGEAEQDTDEVLVWLEPDRMALDLSPAFAGVPAEVLAESGIPAAVIEGPVELERSGDALEGGLTLLAQMCRGRLMLDPTALLGLIGSPHVTSFEEQDGDDYAPLRPFTGLMPADRFLEAMGLSPATLVNQLAMLGCDLRAETGSGAVAHLAGELASIGVQLAWFVDELERVHTAQAVLNLRGFFNKLFTSDRVLASFAEQEQVSVEEMRTFIAEADDAGRLAYVNATWQVFDFDVTDEVVEWPEATDISESVAAQAARLRELAEQAADADL